MANQEMSSGRDESPLCVLGWLGKRIRAEEMFTPTVREREREMSLLGLHYFLQVKGTRRKRVNRLVSIVCVCVCVCLLVIERIRKRIGGRITRERKATPQSGASAGRVIDAFSLAGRPGWPVPSSA